MILCYINVNNNDNNQTSAITTLIPFSYVWPDLKIPAWSYLVQFRLNQVWCKPICNCISETLYLIFYFFCFFFISADCISLNSCIINVLFTACKVTWDSLWLSHFSDHELRHIVFVVHVYAEKSVFKLSRFVVDRNNVRQGWFTGKSEQNAQSGLLNNIPNVFLKQT